jgi:uncharacterized protein (TIGR00369 family)
VTARKRAGDGLAPKPPSDSYTETKTVMELQHLNIAHTVHGGEIFRLVDNAGALAAFIHSDGPVVTAAIDNMSFLKPVHLGDLVTVTAVVNATYRTSMEVGLTVSAYTPRTREVRAVATAYLVFVAVDDADGQEAIPRAVPPLLVRTDEEQQRQRDAALRQASRLRLRAALQRAAGGATSKGGRVP